MEESISRYRVQPDRRLQLRLSTVRLHALRAVVLNVRTVNMTTRNSARLMVKRLAQVRDFADRLVRAGAVMILPKGRERRQRVEKLAWRGPHAVSWMNGAKQHGAHRLTFDDLRGVTKHGVYFLRGSHIVGYLLREASAEPKHRSGLFGMNGHLAPAVHAPHSRRE